MIVLTVGDLSSYRGSSTIKLHLHVFTKTGTVIISQCLGITESLRKLMLVNVNGRMVVNFISYLPREG